MVSYFAWTPILQASHMKIDVYMSRKHKTKFLSVPTGADISKVNLPEDPDLQSSMLVHFKTMDIQAGEHRVAFNADEVIRQINEQGFAKHGPGFNVTETIVRSQKNS
jgi:hypothetical protein